MIYTVKTFNQKKISIKVNSAGEIDKGKYCTNERWFISLPFIVTNLTDENSQPYLDNILLPEEDFNLQNSKKQITTKIKAELVRLAEHKEWQVTI